MEGRKIKNIVILILLLLNGCLLFLVGGRWFEDSHSHETARSRAIEVVRAGGVELEEGAVPREMTLKRMQMTRDLSRESRLASNLLGGTVSVQAQGGEVYRYHNEKGWIQFHSTGEFVAELEPGVFATAGQDEAVYGAALLKQLDFDCRLPEDGRADAEGSVTFYQLWQGTPVLNCQATLNYRENCLISITSARSLPGEPRYSPGEESMSVATALMRLYNGLKELGDIYTRIEQIEPAYTMSVGLSGTAQLTPVWYVKTDTGTYQMDTQTGQISRIGNFAVTADAPVALLEE